VTAALAGAGAGCLRLDAIDSGALRSPPGARVSVRGFVAATPTRSGGTISVRVDTPRGRVLVEAPEPRGDLPIGREIDAVGSLRAAPPWEREYLARNGIAEVLAAGRIRLTGRVRGGLAGAIDGIRDRAATALGRGTSQDAAALLRGFVLGEADRIDAATVSDFRRSGLAHLLAVSGENVLLLALLATPVLALLGVPLRARMIGLLALIALYVLVTGASPSIQRAGIMGAAGVVAALAGRPRSRWYAVLLAATATLVMNPRATGDPGWQLSFAAVIGLMLGAAPVRDLLLGGARDPSALRRTLAEGAGVTISATLATAPLIAADFGVASLTTLPANLLALPAVAPVMWLGMIVSALGQIPGLPVAPLTALAGALGGYVAQIAHWLGSPAWAQASVPEVGVPVLAVLYAALAVSCWLWLGFLRRRRGIRPRGRGVLLATACALVALAALAGSPGSATAPAPTPGLRVEVLDVGQGDAILLDPAFGLPVLVDGGPPGDGIADKLHDAGVTHLAAAVVTHDQSDHAGGIEDLLGRMPIDHLVYGEPVPGLLALGRARGAAPLQVADGSEIDSGRLRLQFIWPPRALESRAQARSGDPNLSALVAVARWHRFAILLTADAEAADVPIAPGPIDVLKVAHHGSDDPGLAHLLEAARPRLAVISVGADNSYGHPTASTLATLAAHGVPVERTDLDGTIEIDVTPRGWSVRATG